MILTKEEFRVIFSNELIGAFPSTEINKFTTKLYWEHFREIPVDKFAEAAHRAVSELSFFPKIGQLNKYLNDIAGVISYDEACVLIEEVLDKSYNGSWKSSDYPEIVGNIIEKCGGVSYMRQMTADTKLITLKKIYNDIVQDIKKKNNEVKQLR